MKRRKRSAGKQQRLYQPELSQVSPVRKNRSGQVRHQDAAAYHGLAGDGRDGYRSGGHAVDGLNAMGKTLLQAGGPAVDQNISEK
jgi:hypothetical protein